jgi:hypothetical protein
MTAHNTFQYLEAGQLIVADVTLRRGWSGDATAVYPETSLTRALRHGRLDQTTARQFIGGLPESSLTDAIVELRQPVADPGALLRLWELGASCLAGYVEPPFAGRQRALTSDVATDGQWPVRDASVSWNCADRRGFAVWARGLGHRDDKVLAELRLPAQRQLEQIADRGLLYGFYLQSLSKTQLRMLLTDQRVAAVTPVVSALGVPSGLYAP